MYVCIYVSICLCVCLSVHPSIHKVIISYLNLCTCYLILSYLFTIQHYTSSHALIESCFHSFTVAFGKTSIDTLLTSAFTGSVFSWLHADTQCGQEKLICTDKTHTLSCVSARVRWRIRPPLFCQLMCARLQTRSREPPAAAQPVSGKRPAQTATGAEEGGETGELLQEAQLACRVIFIWWIITEASTGNRKLKKAQTQTERNRHFIIL